MTKRHTVMEEVIQAFDGRMEKVAVAVGVSYQTIRNWRAAGSLKDAKGQHLAKLAEALALKDKPIALHRLVGEGVDILPEPPSKGKSMKSRWLLASPSVPEQGASDRGSSPVALLVIPVLDAEERTAA